MSNRHMTWCKRSWWTRIDDGSLQRKAQGLASSQKNSSRSNADVPVNALHRKFVVEEATAFKLKELLSKGELLFFAINVNDYVAESLNDGIMRATDVTLVLVYSLPTVTATSFVSFAGNFLNIISGHMTIHSFMLQVDHFVFSVGHCVMVLVSRPTSEFWIEALAIRPS